METRKLNQLIAYTASKATNPDLTKLERIKASQQLKMLHRMRTPEQVEQLEKEMGLTQ